MNFGFADIRVAIVIFLQLFAQALELPAADILKVDAVRPCSRCFVKENGDAVALPDFVANTFGKRNTVLDAHAIHWYERNDVRRSHTRVRARVRGHVNQFQCLAGPKNRSLSYSVWFS